MENPITELSQLDMDKTYSYADYASWQFDNRLELFHGKINIIEHSPNILHHDISKNLRFKLSDFAKRNNFYFLAAPFDVALLGENSSEKDDEIFTVVQPDLMIVCDEDKLADGKKCVGSPDLIIEIVGDDTITIDLDIKYDLYEEVGVKEYWMVHPQDRSVQIFSLKEERFIGLKPVIENQVLNSPLFPDLKMDLRKVFI